MRRLSSSSSSFFCPVLCFILLLLIITIIFWQPGSDWLKKKEGYSNLGLNPGAFPLMVDQPLLFNDYKVQTQPGESGLNASDIYVNYPIFPATSMQNNNIRYWTRPTNGTCTPPEMCRSRLPGNRAAMSRRFFYRRAVRIAADFFRLNRLPDFF